MVMVDIAAMVDTAAAIVMGDGAGPASDWVSVLRQAQSSAAHLRRPSPPLPLIVGGRRVLFEICRSVNALTRETPARGNRGFVVRLEGLSGG